MTFKKLVILVAGLVLSLCCTSPLFALEATVSPMVGGYVFENNLGLKNSPVYSLGLGLKLNDKFHIEGTADYVETELDGTDTNLNFYSARVGLLYHFPAFDNLTPYALAGVGSLRINGNDDGQLTYGLGAKLGITERVGLRFEARHVVGIDIDKDYDMNDTYNHFAFGAGLVFTLGSIDQKVQEPYDAAPVAEKPVVAPVNPEPVKPVDSDNDGVIDALDSCPGTPANTVVDAIGCPKPVRFIDTDEDGVSDSLDACPNTPLNVEVDVRGCPLPDSDADGINDRDDKCPGTAAQIPVDQYGCPELTEELKIAGLVIEYATSQTGFSEEAARELRLLAAKVAATQAGKLVVEGHTDSVGSEAYNIKLSQQRAETVRKALIDEFGVDPERVIARGYGPFEPVATNNTQEGRQQNRRVVVRYEP